jgi:bacteriocin-like protein
MQSANSEFPPVDAVPVLLLTDKELAVITGGTFGSFTGSKSYPSPSKSIP